MRISSFVAKALGLSRRRAGDLLKKSPRKFRVNGRPFDGDLSFKVDPEEDIVEFEGRRLRLPEHRYVIFFKPAGVVTSVRDRFNRTVMDLLPGEFARLKPVGRLDKDSRGLLLLTDDGEIVHPLLHPRYGVVKEYLVKVRGKVSEEELEQVRKGMDLGDFKSMPCEAEAVEVGLEYSRIRLRMREGKKRQIRRMFARLGHPVVDLLRIGFGPLRLGRLKEGQWRDLSPDEVSALKDAVQRR